jgi:stress-induced-phosphoprotein 1
MLPSISSIQIFHGKCDTIVEPASSSSGFTRVAITDDSDSDSESDEEEEDGDRKSWSSTRVQIIEEDDEDEYEEVLEEPVLISSTRVEITEDDSDSDSDVEDIASTPKPFIASATFTGSKQGYYFKKGDSGVGYYLDKFQKPPEVLKKVTPAVTKASEVVNSIANTTRISISEDDSDSDEEENDKELALQLKDKGNSLYKDKDYEGAIKCYSDSLLKDPSLISAANNRAMSYIALKKYNETIIDCNFVIKTEPMNIKALYRRALSMFEIDKLDNSSADIKMILSIDPKNVQAIALNNDITKRSTADNVIDDSNYELTIKKLKEKAQYELASGDAKSALETLTKALELVKSIDGYDKNDSIPLLNMISTSQSVLGNFSSVVDNCTIILGIDAKNFKSLIRRAEALIKMVYILFNF